MNNYKVICDDGSTMAEDVKGSDMADVVNTSSIPIYSKLSHVKEEVIMGENRKECEKTEGEENEKL